MRASGLSWLLVVAFLQGLASVAVAEDSLPGGARCRLGSPANPLLSICFSPDSQTIAVAGYDNTLGIWDAATGKRVGQWKTPEGSTACLCYSPSGKLLASGGLRDSTIHLWEPSTGRLVRDLEGLPRGVTSLSFSPDGRYLAAGGYGTDAVYLWEAATGKELSPLTGPRVPVQDENFQGGWGVQYGHVTFAPDGKTLASGHTLGLVRVWDFARRRETHHFRGDTTDAFVHVAFSPDGTVLATWSQAIRLWKPVPRAKQDINSITTWAESLGFTTPAGWVQQRVFANEPEKQNTGMAFSPDNRLVAAGSAGHVSRDSLVHIWEVASGSERMQLPGHEYDVTATAFSPDGSTLASASRDGTVLLWDLKALQTVNPQGEADPIEAGENCWQLLGQPDAGLAAQAMRSFLRAPARTVSFLATHLKRLEPVSEDQIKSWVYALDNKSFLQRETAAENLSVQFEVAEAQLRLLLLAQTSPEVRRRLQLILKSCGMGELAKGQLQTIRAIEVLEDVASPEARAILEKLSGGDSRLRSTREAMAALQRMKKSHLAQRFTKAD
jgi:WD40 repeat protein